VVAAEYARSAPSNQEVEVHSPIRLQDVVVIHAQVSAVLRRTGCSPAGVAARQLVVGYFQVEAAPFDIEMDEVTVACA
jgi:hypothetical protein